VSSDYRSEFAFELRVCAWVERAWGSVSDADAWFVARQLGTRSRRWDTVVVECDPEGLRARAAFGDVALDSDLLHVVQHAPEDWTYYRECLPHPGYPWRYVREAIHEAAEKDVVEKRKNGNRIEIRAIAPYPDWVRRIVAIENKPDLDASAARTLADQVRTDVALALADEVWVATQGDALFAKMPVQAGILQVADGDASVEWRPRALDPDRPGTRVLDHPGGGEYDQSAAEFEYVDADWKAEKRLAIAERAYARGWRSFADTMRPDCRSFALARDDHFDAYVPYCRAKDREVSAAECAWTCDDFAPEPPAWRTRGWPIEGGPGKTITRLLAARRRRTR
jgi:hypothetical protein